jgi:hypothetical protein
MSRAMAYKTALPGSCEAERSPQNSGSEAAARRRLPEGFHKSIYILSRAYAYAVVPTRTRLSPNAAMIKAALKNNWVKVYEALDNGCNVDSEYMGNTLGTIAMGQISGLKALEHLVEEYDLNIYRPIEGHYSLLSYAKYQENFFYIASRMGVQDVLDENAVPTSHKSCDGDFVHSPVRTAIKYSFDSRAFDALKALEFDFDLLSPYSKNTFLFTAIRDNNMPALGKLLDIINANKPNIYNEVPIMWACQNGNTKAVDILIKHHVNLSVSSIGYREKNKNGMDIKTKKFESERPLIAWVRGSPDERLSIYDLLHGRANFNVPTSPHGYTKYMQESFSGDLQCMKALNERHGADAFITDKRGHSALTWSALSYNPMKFSYNMSIFRKHAAFEGGTSYLKELYSIKKRILSKFPVPLSDYISAKNVSEVFGIPIADLPSEDNIHIWTPLGEELYQIYIDVTNEIQAMEDSVAGPGLEILSYLRRV